MLIHREEYQTKELISALKKLEKAIQKVNKLGFVPFCGGGSAGVSIHTIEDWNSVEGFTNQNIVATLDNVLTEGGDY